MRRKSQLSRLRERWYWILGGLVIGLLAGAGITTLQVPTYSASVTLYISSRDAGESAFSAYQGSLLSEQRVKSYAQIVTSPQILRDIAEKLSLPPARAANLKERLSAVAEPDTVLLTITAMDTTSDGATQLADTVGQELVGAVADLERPAVPTDPAPVSARIMSEATPSDGPVSPSWLLNLWLACVVGGSAGDRRCEYARSARQVR